MISVHMSYMYFILFFIISLIQLPILTPSLLFYISFWLNTVRPMLSIVSVLSMCCILPVHSVHVSCIVYLQCSVTNLYL